MFRVHWKPSTVADLATVCVEHPDRWSDIDVAENDIVYKLRKNPLRYSQPVAEGLRRIISTPLAVYFIVDGDDVMIDAIGWVREPPL